MYRAIASSLWLINILPNKLNILIYRIINDDDEGKCYFILCVYTCVLSCRRIWRRCFQYTCGLSHRATFSRRFMVGALIWDVRAASWLLPTFFDSQIKESQVHLYCSRWYFGARLRRTVIYARNLCASMFYGRVRQCTEVRLDVGRYTCALRRNSHVLWLTARCLCRRNDKCTFFQYC